MLCLVLDSRSFPSPEARVVLGSNRSVGVPPFIRKSIYDAPCLRIEDSLLFTLSPRYECMNAGAVAIRYHTSVVVFVFVVAKVVGPGPMAKRDSLPSKPIPFCLCDR